jgi:hypothetical protein
VSRLCATKKRRAHCGRRSSPTRFLARFFTCTVSEPGSAQAPCWPQPGGGYAHATCVRFKKPEGENRALKEAPDWLRGCLLGSNLDRRILLLRLLGLRLASFQGFVVAPLSRHVHIFVRMALCRSVHVLVMLHRVVRPSTSECLIPPRRRLRAVGHQYRGPALRQAIFTANLPASSR